MPSATLVAAMPEAVADRRIGEAREGQRLAVRAADAAGGEVQAADALQVHAHLHVVGERDGHDGGLDEHLLRQRVHGGDDLVDLGQARRVVAHDDELGGGVVVAARALLAGLDALLGRRRAVGLPDGRQQRAHHRQDVVGARVLERVHARLGAVRLDVDVGGLRPRHEARAAADGVDDLVHGHVVEVAGERGVDLGRDDDVAAHEAAQLGEDVGHGQAARVELEVAGIAPAEGRAGRGLRAGGRGRAAGAWGGNGRRRLRRRLRPGPGRRRDLRGGRRGGQQGGEDQARGVHLSSPPTRPRTSAGRRRTG
jgi:hypothetical protein